MGEAVASKGHEKVCEMESAENETIHTMDPVVGRMKWND